MTLLRLEPLPNNLPELSDDEFDRVLREYGGELVHPQWVTRTDEFASQFPYVARNCSTCEGRGIFLGWNSTRDATATYLCNCVDQWHLRLCLMGAGLGRQWQGLGTDDLDKDSGAAKAVIGYLTDFDSNLRYGRGMLFSGELQTGKTLCAVLLLKLCIRRGYYGMYVTFDRMVERYTEGWKDPSKAEWFTTRIKNARVLVIDEVGNAYEGRNDDLMGRVIREVLIHRVESGLPTFLTSAQPFDVLVQRWDWAENVLGSSMDEYHFSASEGASWREKAKERLKLERKLGIQRPAVL